MIFDDITGDDAQVLFLFNDAPSHQKCADNALSTCLMVKGASYIIPWIFKCHSLSAPKDGLTHNKSGTHMHCGTLPNSEEQSFYFAADHHLMPAGSRVWSRSFASMGCGQKQDYLLSATSSSVLLITPTAAVGASCIYSLISLLKSHSLQN